MVKVEDGLTLPFTLTNVGPLLWQVQGKSIIKGADLSEDNTLSPKIQTLTICQFLILY